VDDLVAGAARRDPGALAVAGPDASLTYADLLRRADALADRLRSLGVGREDLVGLCVPRSAALVVGALGILRAGAAYVALDPSSPSERLEQMLTDSDVRVVVASPASSVDSRPPARAGATVVELTPDGAAEVGGGGTGGGSSRASASAEGSPLAYVVYTSGSTGSPKGVLVEHAGLMNLVAWHQRAFEITAADRGTQVASPAFDAAAWEIWPYLAAGASVHVPPVAVRADPQALRDWLVAQGITVSFLPTALAERVSLLEWPSTAALRIMLTGGDRLRQAPPEGLPYRLVNNYGLSEATVVSTSGPVRRGEGGAPTIGAAIDGVHLAVVDGDQETVPAGDVGELMVGGVSVARGYLGQPELTRRKFVTPAWAGPAERWYRTGDLVRLRPDGEVEFLGRLDDQVQVRGVRIEPGEVSARLDRHPDIRASVVTAVGEDPGQRRLYAHLVARDETRKPSRPQLQDYLGTHLPEYMIPAGFGWIQEIPSTENGKVDRAALPAPVFDDAAPSLDTAPGSDLEEAITAVVAELLGREQVAPQDNFFLLGGHSLLGAQLIARVSEQFGVSLDLRALFDNPTPMGLAGEVERLIVEETESLTDEEAAQLLDQLDARSVAPTDGSRG
jgi:amino acid adenylation domain-containing protein